MKNFSTMLRYPASDDGSGEGSAGTQSQHQNLSTPPDDFYAPATPAGEQKPATPPPAEEKPPGYEKPPVDTTGDKNAATPPPAVEDSKPPGYESDSTAKPATPPPDEKKPDQGKEAGEIEFSTEGIGEKEALRIKEIAKSQKLTKEQAEALVKYEKEAGEATKAEATRIQNEVKARIESTRKGWYEELKSDPVFGKENFNTSLGKVEKVLKDHFPGLRKDLTDNGRMLPPVVMRELAALHKHLYGSAPFVNGDAGAGKNENQFEFLNELY